MKRDDISDISVILQRLTAEQKKLLLEYVKALEAGDRVRIESIERAMIRK